MNAKTSGEKSDEEQTIHSLKLFIKYKEKKITSL